MRRELQVPNETPSQEILLRNVKPSHQLKIGRTGLERIWEHRAYFLTLITMLG